MAKQNNQDVYDLTEMFRRGFLIKQRKTPKGFTVSLGRTKLGAWAEPFADKNGYGHDLTEILKAATWGMPGMTVRQSTTGRKEVFVDITGL